MPDRLAVLVSQVFGVEAEQVSDSDSPDTLGGWDSMGHLNLVLAIEEEFELSLTTSETDEMLSVGLIRTILREKGLSVQ